MTFKTNHVAFTVNDLEESLKWYQNKLGFELVNKYKNAEMEFALLKLNDVKVELFNFGKQTEPLPQHSKNLMDDLHVVGIKHLCIEVDSLDKTIKELESKGVEFATKVDTTAFGGRYIFFKDCNGILIELYQSPR